jgi:hypothetical protein
MTNEESWHRMKLEWVTLKIGSPLVCDECESWGGDVLWRGRDRMVWRCRECGKVSGITSE